MNADGGRREGLAAKELKGHKKRTSNIQHRTLVLRAGRKETTRRSDRVRFSETTKNAFHTLNFEPGRVAGSVKNGNGRVTHALLKKITLPLTPFSGKKS